MIICTCLYAIAGMAAPKVNFAPTPKWVTHVPPAGRAVNAREVNDGYYLKLYETEINVATNEVYGHVINHIVSTAGVQNVSNISLNFNPSYEQLTLHQVTVWRNGQPLDKTKDSKIKVIANEEDLQMFIYDGNYTAYIIVDDVRQGDEVEYAYTTKGSNPIIPKQSYSLTLQGREPISQLHYYFIAPKSRTFTFKYFKNCPEAVVTDQDNSVVYDWQLSDLPANKYNDVSPAWFNPYPHVQISEFKSWQEVADWAYSINKPADHLSGPLKARVEQLKKKYGEDSASLFRAMVEMVQDEVRYMGVEIGEYSHKANNPEKVYAQRYGDCKDKSLLLVSILHQAGIAAEVALTHSSRRNTMAQSLPGPFVFNQAIVLAHLAGEEIWIDPTISYQGGKGVDFYCPPYRKALVLAPGTTSLKDIPETPGGTVNYSETYTIGSESSPALLTIHTKFTGQRANNMRLECATRSKTDQEKNYLDYYTKKYPHIESADTLMINDDREANVLETIEQYSIPDFMEYDSVRGSYQAEFYATVLKNMLPTVEKTREYPIALSYPSDIRYTIRVESPIKWNITPKSAKINRSSYSFLYDVSSSDALTISYDLSFHKDNIDPEEITQYEADRKKIVDEYLSYAFTYRSGTANSGVNIWAILVFIALLLGSTYAAIRVYTMKTNTLNYHQPRPISGWLYLPALGLLIGFCRKVYSFTTTNYFRNSMWQAFDAERVSVTYKAILWFELVGNSLMMFLTLFCIILFFKKRDILPRTIISLYLGSAIIIVLDAIFAHLAALGGQPDYNSIVQSVTAMLIWGPIFANSPQVRDTFIVPYRENYMPPTNNTEKHEDQMHSQIPPETINEPEETDKPEDHSRFMPPGATD